MSNQKYSLDFNILKTGFWVSAFLVILKYANVIDLSIWWVLTPLFVGLGSVFIIIFLIGLVTLYLISVKGIELPDDEDDYQEDETEDEIDS